MSYDDDNPELFSVLDEDQLLMIELERLEKEYKSILPDTIPWFENESDEYEEVINKDIEYPYDE